MFARRQAHTHVHTPFFGLTRVCTILPSLGGPSSWAAPQLLGCLLLGPALGPGLSPVLELCGRVVRTGWQKHTSTFQSLSFSICEKGLWLAK